MITKSQFGTVEALFNYYNREIFSGELNDCMLSLSRRGGSTGFFAPERWQSPDGGKKVHEIGINPDTFDIDDEGLHRTMVHEMCHLWQFDFGTPSRRGYHNREWADKMVSIGLMPSDTGKEGGKRTGQHMEDYAIEGGLFKGRFDAIKKGGGNLALPYWPVNRPDFRGVRLAGPEGAAPPASGVRTKYTCPCGNNVWGKQGLGIMCTECNGPFEANV